MADGKCTVCGRIIPEGNHICLHCMGAEMQTFRTRIRTNGDFLRSLSNEDLARWLVRVIYDIYDTGKTDDAAIKTAEAYCLAWLESEAKS